MVTWHWQYSLKLLIVTVIDPSWHTVRLQSPTHFLEPHWIYINSYFSVSMQRIALFNNVLLLIPQSHPRHTNWLDHFISLFWQTRGFCFATLGIRAISADWSDPAGSVVVVLLTCSWWNTTQYCPLYKSTFTHERMHFPYSLETETSTERRVKSNL